MEELIVVRTSDSHVVHFNNVDEPMVDPATGRLYISQDGRDIACFNQNGWVFYGRPELTQEPEVSEAPEPEEEADPAWDAEFDDDILDADEE
jgi:hypothetical protein